VGKLWDKGATLDTLIEAYTVGDDPTLDQRLVPHDVEGSRAHARMLRSIDVLDDLELSSLLEALDAVEATWKAGEFVIERSDEDVHTAVERFLVARLGDVGKKIHTGRSRNDQVLVDVALWQRAAVQDLREALGETIGAFEAFAYAHPDVPMPGYTHLQRAMPSSVTNWSAGYASLLKLDWPLVEAAGAMVSRSPLGSAAGYGVPDVLGIDRAMTAKDLGFKGPLEPAEACQSSRGKAEAALLFACSEIARDLGKWAWDLCLYVTAEFGFFALPTAFTTGSSIMPQKRNPDVLELTRAKAATVRAALTEVMAIAGALPSGYHRDLQLLKGPLFRGVDTTLAMLAVAAHVMRGLTVNEERCAEAMTPELFATEEAYRLVREGVPFREAYRRVGEKYKG
jgi:argininosuccinate lyase